MSAAAFLTFETMQKRSRSKQIMQRVFNRFKVQTEFTNKPQLRSAPTKPLFNKHENKSSANKSPLFFI
jgi:hypothetical protein